MNNLESIFTSVMLKIKSLKIILKHVKPKIYDKSNSTNTWNKAHQIKILSIIATCLKSTCCAEDLENEILHYAYNYQMNIINIDTYNKLLNTMNNIEQNYRSKISTLIRNFDINSKNIQEITSEYNLYILQSGFISHLSYIADTLFDNLKKIHNNPQIYYNISINSKEYDIIKQHLNLYNKYRIEVRLEKLNLNICEDCNIKLTIDYNRGILLCNTCGMLSKLSGDVMEDVNIYIQENKSKNTTYDASNHCDFWLKRIFALEPTELDDNIIILVKLWLKKNGYSTTCRYIRYALAKIKINNKSQSCNNTHVSLIRKLITGKAPEPPTHDERNKIFNYFYKAVEAYHNIKRDVINIKYYPYFIWKIMEMIYPDPARRTEILECIHLQNLDTLKKNDKIWRQICQQVPEFKFKSTDRSYQYMYCN